MELKIDPTDIELLEKAGYCHQQMNQLHLALKYYEQISIQGKSGSWIVKNMGFCYRQLEDYDKALEIYQKAAIDNPDDIKIESLIGFCNLKLENYDTALKHYFKIEYLNPENKTVIRPIAWCYFVLGDLEKSDKYYLKVIGLEPDYYDYVNYGHLKWALGDRKAAIENYILSTNYGNFSFKELQKTMLEDTAVLKKAGIEEEEIFLMMDYLRYKLR
jgi:tetratricopeptide (TPR) repeat protein